ncbi:UBX domain protein [Aspergillus chevalieri]|uniref:UBX domain-containing protein n=1 Tax=Aspergillus chevalieri TaxID=182096 RepID=A0A7R7VVL7_ASPCH|nr:uncharacterized protein ACHE_70448A [Aspergillus chevalieri]BCR91605.1 hypothetical protein ACHE_70448A [Aspergillus chevalieri]
MFYQGTLQEGIALAVSQSKAVVCFVRDDEELSNVWENEYLADDPTFARLFVEEAITLRLPTGSEGATYLTSFCPIPKLPGLVVIRNGMMREYIIPEISKDDFRARLRAVLEDERKSSQVPRQTQSDVGHNSAASPAAPTSGPAPVTQLATSAPQVAQSQPQTTPATNETKRHRDENERAGKPSGQKQEPPRRATPSKTPSQKPQQQQESRINQTKQPDKKTPQTRKAAPEPSTTSKTSDTEVRPKPALAPPKKYRLQIRLFDGSSIRSSFDPSQTISKDVRPWLDDQMDEKRPFNLKHILTPLPNRTLTIADEEQTLQAYLGLGATANLVMVPIQSYTEAYTGSGSLPVRAVSSAYDLATSTVGAAAGYVGSWFGYGQTSASQGSPATEPSSASDHTGRTASRLAGSRGPNIRTLADQRREQGNNQFYNGNQLNFQPRDNSDQR